MFRFVLTGTVTLLFLMIARALAQEDNGGLSRFADEDERTIIYHRKSALGTHQ